MTSHDLDDRHGFFLIDIGIQSDLTDSRCNIFGSTSEARCMIRMDQVIIDRLRLADHTDGASNFGRIAGKFADSIHGIISTDIEKPADVHLLKLAEKLRIDRIFERFRQFVTAGTKICARCVSKIRKLLARKSFLKIKHTTSQESLDPIDHAINMSDFIRMGKPLRNNSIKAAVDHGSRSAGLSDDKIFL